MSNGIARDCRRYHQVDLGKILGKTEVEVRRMIRDGVVPAPSHRLDGGKRPYYTEAEVREIARSYQRLKQDAASLPASELEDALVLIRQASFELDARWRDRFGRIADRLNGLIGEYRADAGVVDTDAS